MSQPPGVPMPVTPNVAGLSFGSDAGVNAPHICSSSGGRATRGGGAHEGSEDKPEATARTMATKPCVPLSKKTPDAKISPPRTLASRANERLIPPSNVMMRIGLACAECAPRSVISLGR